MSFDDLREPAADPGSFTLSPQNTGAKRAGRPLFGPRKGSTFLLKNPNNHTDTIPFRVGDPDRANHSSLEATLRRYRRELQAPVYEKLKKQIHQEAVKHRHARFLGSVGAIISLKR